MSEFIYTLSPAFRSILTWLSRRRLPGVTASHSVSGLSGKVEVIHDKYGVPHIYAGNLSDLFFAQGFAHAQDRFWQMELNRRTATGTLSELFGAIALDTDRAVRTFGFSRLGREDLKNAGDAILSAVEAYTHGVNAFLQNRPKGLPVEFTLLGHSPHPWTIEDTMALSRMMIWQLGHAWYGEIIRAKLVEAVGAEHASDWEIADPGHVYTTCENGIEFNRIEPSGLLRPELGPFLSPGKGSNVWALAGSRTVTGAPIFCNDMHMELSLPGLWYENHLTAPGFNTTGVSLPGTPIVLVGHNERIAWGCTLAYTDCEDLFVEKINPENSHQYRYLDQWQDMEVIPEKITVKGRKEPFLEEVRITRHGPIISHMWSYPEKALADQSTCLQPSHTLDGWYAVNLAAGWDDFVRAMKLIEAPQINFGYSDVDGNIGIWTSGRHPIRASGDGSIPAPGWSGTHEWIDEVPFEQMPHLFNPAKGYLANGNNRLVEDDYPYFLGGAWMNGYRTKRVSQLIEEKGKLGIQDCASIQVDQLSLPAAEFLTLLDGLPEDDADIRLALSMLHSWDCQLVPGSTAAAVYEVTRNLAVRALLEPVLGKKLTDETLGASVNTVLYGDNEFYGHDTRALLRILTDENNWWLAKAGGREKVLCASLKTAVEFLRAKLGADPASWQWGRIHQLTLEHAMGMQKPLDRVFNRGPFPMGGDTDTVWQTAMMPDTPYNARLWQPSMRHIIDMGDLSRSMFVMPFGQSGHLASPHYDDLTAFWLKGELVPMLWTRAQVEAAVSRRTSLVPAMG
jgi:penicillin amidase